MKLWEFPSEREDRIDDFPLDMTWFEDIVEHLWLDDSTMLNLLVLSEEDRLRIQNQDISSISLREVFDILGIKSYKFWRTGFRRNNVSDVDKATYRWQKNIFWDLNIDDDLSSSGRWNEIVYFFSEEDVRSGTKKLVDKIRWKVSENILVSK